MRPVLLAMLLCACDVAGPSFSSYDGATTDGVLARSNLDARVGALESLERRGSMHPGVFAELTEARLSRASFFGVHGDLDRARAARVDEGSADALALAARVAGAVHELDEAEALLDRATALDGDERALARSTIDLAHERNLQDVLRLRQRRASERPTFERLAELAPVYAALGRFDEADETYVRALRSYRDVSPFVVAAIQFQRGVMWAERADRPELALPLYRDAVARLPGYVVANVHLAELESPDAAIERLRRLAEETEDPEPASVLAELLMARDPEAAARYRDRATERYDSLLARFPDAFADHAAEHFMGPGADPERAWRLASSQLEARRTDRHLQLSIDAALATGRASEACALSREARSRTSVNLRERAREVLLDCPG